MTGPGRRSFTLVELVVVTGIIVLLVGLTLSVGTAVIASSETRQTESVLRLLDTAIAEWELQADRRLAWANASDPADVKAAADLHEDTREIFLITELLRVISRQPDVKKMIAGIDPDLVHRYEAGTYPPWLVTPDERADMDGLFDGGLVVLDAWGTPIYPTHPGRTHQAGDTWGPDTDGTNGTYNEQKYGIAENRRVRFVSAGPDGKFGNLMSSSLPDHADTADNLYSYPLAR